MRQLGAILDVTHGYVAQLENGSASPSTKMVLKIADVFGVCIDRLMRDELELEEG